MKYQTNGKIEEQIEQINGLKDVIGLRTRNIFKSKTQEELEERMSDMSLIDLQRMAVACGVSGGGNRTVLKNKIKSEFIKFLKGSLDGISSVNNKKINGSDARHKSELVYELMQ